MVPRVARIRPAETLARQLRQQPAVIDMRMGQKHGVDIGRAERERPIVQRLQCLRPLEQAAVDEEAAGRCVWNR